MKRILSIAFMILIISDTVPCKFLKSNIVSFAADDAIATITKDSESELLEAVK